MARRRKTRRCGSMAEARTLDEGLPVHGMGRVGTPWWGMLCLFATEGILFAYLIFSYAYLGSQGYQAWPPTGGPPSLTRAVRRDRGCKDSPGDWYFDGVGLSRAQSKGVVREAVCPFYRQLQFDLFCA